MNELYDRMLLEADAISNTLRIITTKISMKHEGVFSMASVRKGRLVGNSIGWWGLFGNM